MFPGFATIGLKVWGYVIAAGAALVGILTLFAKVKQAGRNEVTTAVNADTADKTKKMLDAATQAPKEIKDVQNDLRSGKF